MSGGERGVGMGRREVPEGGVAAREEMEGKSPVTYAARSTLRMTFTEAKPFHAETDPE